MTKTDIFIARHGETEFNRTHRIQGRGINEPLNRTGRLQAQSIGRLLAGENIDSVFSSSLRRSVETAEIIATELQLSVHSHTELDEMDFGIIEGKPIDQIKTDLAELHNQWKNGKTGFAVQNGESPKMVLDRALLRLDALLNEHRGQHVLFVLHGRLIRILLAHWLDYGLSQMHRIEHQNGALYHLRVSEDGQFEPVFLNDTSHLT